MQRVLIIRPGALGDTLMLLPALKNVAQKVCVTFVGRHPGLDFIRPHVDRAMDLEASGWHRLFMDPPKGNALPVSNMDVVAAFFSKEEETIRRNLEQSLPGAAIRVFRSCPTEGKRIHVAEYLARCLEDAGLPVDPAQSVAGVRKGLLCRDRGLPKGERRIVLHPGSGSRDKNYPPEFWVDLSHRFRRDERFQDVKQVLLLGPAEEPLHAFFIKNLRSGAADIRMSYDGDLLLNTLDSAALYVGHDSGVTHLSALRCVPTVALFRNSDPNQWAPLGPWVRVIEARDPGPGLIERIVMAPRVLVGSTPIASRGGRNQMA